MITITKYPGNYSFTGNPVIFELSSDSDEPVNVEISFNGYTQLATYYPFQLSENSYKISMDLSDYLNFDNKIEISGNQIISAISGFALPYQVKIGSNYTFNGFALRGGISNQAFRKLDENGYSIFTYRLASSYEQFLFTTRTNGKEIKLKETELYPFIFRHPGLPVIFRSESGDEVTTPAQAAGTFCAMNIQSVLEQMPAGTRRIEVCPNGEYAFHFTILPGKLSEERYLLKFRNSLGAFEILEVTGKAMHAPEFSEENLWETLADLYFYEERRSRVKSKGIIEVETGYKERLEFPFILDLIQSDEIYFIYPDGDSFRCHLTADSAQYRHLMTEPTSVELKIRPVVEEEFVTPKIEFPEESEISLILSKYNISFNENGGTDNIEVIIQGTQNRSYSILNIPSWLTLTNKTETGFTLSVVENLTEELRSIELIVQLDAHPMVQAILSVSQDGAWLSEFIFDVDIPSIAAGNAVRIFNLGTDPQAGSLGEVRIDWENNGVWETINNVQYSILQNPAPVDPSTGQSFEVLWGQDFTHSYPTAGLRKVTVQTRNGVNSFRFTQMPATVTSTWHDSLPAGTMNEYVRTIYKIQSNYIKNPSRMFAGVKYGRFPSNFVLECPNITMNPYYMFEFFGCEDFNHAAEVYPSTSWELYFPENFWSAIADKTKITAMTRCFNGSGFLKITRAMLKCSTVLTSVLEAWRGMPVVGHEWSARTGAKAINGGLPIVEEFIETELFWDNPHIEKFNGCFWFINDWYGNYTDSGFIYPLTVRADLFKFNVAPQVDLSWMFKQANRSIVEVDLFRHIRNTLYKADGIFWGSWAQGGNPKIWAYSWLFPGWTNSNPVEWQNSDFNVDYRGACDLNWLIPQPLPNLVSMVCAFGWKFSVGDNIVNGKRNQFHGGQCLVPDEAGGGAFNQNWRGWTGYYPAQLNIEQFLAAKCPAVTASSGTHPTTGATVDGAFACFWDFDMQDGLGQMKASDYNTLSRASVKAESTMIDWMWGLAI